MRVILLICLFAATAAAQMPKIEPGVSQELAKWRAVQYSNISYKLNLTLEKMSPVLKGSIEIHVTQAAYACAEPNCPPMAIVLDWRKLPGHEKESTLSNVSINDKKVVGVPVNAFILEPYPYPIFVDDYDHLVFRDGVKMGENVIKLDFTSPILTSGSAITRYIDKEDGSEYIYSLFVPSDASTAFPCFDQPDLKARFTLQVVGPPSDWEIVSNTTSEHLSIDGATPWNDIWNFPETKPISTYVFAFAAGPFGKFYPPKSYSKAELAEIQRLRSAGRIVDPSFSDLLNLKGERPNIYVRRSQAEKFKAHEAEVFRLTREGIKYLETYFDYKFPFPKLDLVLIPEFPFGGMEHAGAIFLREDRVIFPAEPTKGDYLTRANLIFHETAHQWFGDTVTMKWFDDLWLKEGFAEFMAYKTLEKVMPDANAWKVFYERNKQAAYLTDSTKGTTPIYQPIANLSAAKSAYGNIVYRKAPSFLRQAEFYLGEDKFQTAVRAFLKKHEFGNAGWEDLVKEFEDAAWFDPRVIYHPDDEEAFRSKESELRSRKHIHDWANSWVTQKGMPTIRINVGTGPIGSSVSMEEQKQEDGYKWDQDTRLLIMVKGEQGKIMNRSIPPGWGEAQTLGSIILSNPRKSDVFVFPNYQDYGYGIFLLDDKSRDYVLKNIQNEKDPFLRSMMWGSLWDSVREAELDPKDYVELAIENLPTEKDETISQSILSRVSTAMNYYLSAAQAAALAPRLEAVLLDRLQHAPTAGERITFYRTFVGNATTGKGREVLKEMLRQSEPPAVAGGLTRLVPNANGSPAGQQRVGARKPPLQPPATAGGSDFRLRTKDRFDIVTRLAVLGDPDAAKLLAGLERTETGDDAKRYAYAAHAAFGTAENKAKFFSDFVTNKDISESWIETAIVPFNSIRHADLTQQYLARSLAELPNLKRTRKIFFINNWLAAFIGGQRDEKALAVVNKFLADNPNLDNDLRLKVLENVDLIERAVRIRAKYAKN